MSVTLKDSRPTFLPLSSGLEQKATAGFLHCADIDNLPYSLQRYLTSVSPFEREFYRPITHHTYDHGSGWVCQEGTIILPNIQVNGVPDSTRTESQWIALAQEDPSLSDPDWLIAETLDLRLLKSNMIDHDGVREWHSSGGNLEYKSYLLGGYGNISAAERIYVSNMSPLSTTKVDEKGSRYVRKTRGDGKRSTSGTKMREKTAMNH